MTEHSWAVEHRSTASLKPYARNARRHSKKQIKQIADSIKRFGFTNPVLIADDGEIIAGHGRVAAAKLIGMERVPTLRLSHLTEAERRAYVLADNKLALNAGWDQELLAIELQALVDLDFEVELTGFSLAEIDITLDAARDADPNGATAPEDLIPPMAQMPVTRSGDLWLLGRHKLICGDARRREDYERLLGGETRRPDLRRPALQRADRRPRLRFGPHPPPRVRHGRRRDVDGSLHRLPRWDARRGGQDLPRRRDRLHLHGLAAHRRTAGCWAGGLQRAEEPLRLEQGRRRHGNASIAPSTSSSSSSRSDPARTPTASGSARPAATGPTSGTTRASAAWAPVASRRWRCTRR